MSTKFKGMIAPVAVPTGDGRMFAAGKMTYRPMPLPLLVRFGSGGHDGATVVGKINRIYDGPGGYWAEGEFLDPTQVPEVAKAIYMLQQKVMGPSVDLDRDFTVKAIPHPRRPDKKAGLFEEYNVIGVTLVPMPAFPDVHLSVQSDEDRTLLASVGVDASEWPYFDVNADSWKRWPIAPREYKFDADDAVKRIAFWAGVGSKSPDLDRYASAFLWRDGNQMGDTMAQDSFRLPLADIINGQPYLVYHAVYAAAALLSGAHGGLPNIPDDDKRYMMEVINEVYPVMASAFGDANMKSPFAGTMTQAAIDSECGCSEESTEELPEEPAMNFAANSVTIGGYTAPVSNVVINFVSDDDLEFAKKNPKEPYGDVTYADPGLQPDGKKRYPLDSEEHCRAAWSYINMPKNAAKYTPAQLKQVKGRIKEALKRYGVEVSEDGASSGEMALSDGAPADLQSLLAGAGPLAPPAAWFNDPKLKEPTRLTVSEDGRVFGHLAQWRVCHVGVGNKCVIAPKTRNDYRLFRVGTVLCDDGTAVDVGKITLGTGHANQTWGVMPSREHYDNTGWAAAIVNIGEDKHGIWVSGSLTTHMTPERIAELRQSPLSGDWREVEGNLELVAALAVNNPGFPVYREQAGRAFSLTSVGVVGMEDLNPEFAIDEEDLEYAENGEELEYAEDGEELEYGIDGEELEEDEDEEEEDVEEDEDGEEEDVEEDEDEEVEYAIDEDEELEYDEDTETFASPPSDDVIDDPAELSARLDRLAAIEEDRQAYLAERRLAQLAALDAKREDIFPPRFDQFGIKVS